MENGYYVTVDHLPFAICLTSKAWVKVGHTTGKQPWAYSQIKSEKRNNQEKQWLNLIYPDFWSTSLLGPENERHKSMCIKQLLKKNEKHE